MTSLQGNVVWSEPESPGAHDYPIIHFTSFRIRISLCVCVCEQENHQTPHDYPRVVFSVF